VLDHLPEGMVICWTQTIGLA